MLKIKVNGYLNFGLKLKKKNMFHVGQINVFFLLLLLKKINGINFKFFLKKKNSCNINFIKSNIRYKVSKHLIQRTSNLLTFEVSSHFNKKINFFFLKNFNILSSGVFNLKNIKISKTVLLQKNFLIFVKV